MNIPVSQISKFKLSRRGRKLQVSDDSRILIALPKEVPERTWAEILQKEENDLIALDIREEIVETAVRIVYERYLEKQSALFTVHCAAQAWLKLIDWNFYRHDPGEDPTAHPPCLIPNRVESWLPDELPSPSPKDTWCKEQLVVVEDTSDEVLRTWPSSSSLDMPVVEDIPREYWFPGKVCIPGADRDDQTIDYVSYDDSSSELVSADSELLQRVTDYSTQLSNKESAVSALKTTTPVQVEGSLQGAGDSNVISRQKKDCKSKSKMTSKATIKSVSRSTVKEFGKSKAVLPPLRTASRSGLSFISDCRLRNLRLDTQYEITSEKLDTPPGETGKRK